MCDLFAKLISLDCRAPLPPTKYGIIIYDNDYCGNARTQDSRAVGEMGGLLASAERRETQPARPKSD